MSMLFAVLFSVTDRRAVFLLLGPARDAPLYQARVLQGSDDGDDGDVAGVRQKSRVRSLGWNHVGQIQHVAQRPACVTAFYLETTQEKEKL